MKLLCEVELKTRTKGKSRGCLIGLSNKITLEFKVFLVCRNNVVIN